MKKIITITAVAVIVALLLLCQGRIEHEDASQPLPMAQSADTLPMLVTQVRHCSRLYTAEYQVHKIVTHDDVVRLRGSLLNRQFNIQLPLGDRKIAIPIDAKVKASIDFSLFSEKNVERHGSKITLVLPDPEVWLTSSKIDQKNVRQYVGLTRAHFSDAELSDYERQGRAAIIESIPQLGIIATAQANAAKVLVPMLTEMGYEEADIVIAFRKDLNVMDLIRNIER